MLDRDNCQWCEGYGQGISDAVTALERLTREWLSEAKGEAEDDRVGYPPYHFMRAIEQVKALAVDGGRVESPEPVQPGKPAVTDNGSSSDVGSLPPQDGETR